MIMDIDSDLFKCWN